MTETKPTLGYWRKKYNQTHQASILLSDVAELAQVSIGDVYITELGGSILKQIVVKVVHAFSLLSHQNICIEDIAVRLFDVTTPTR